MKSFGSTLDRAGGSLGSLFDQQNTGLWHTKKNNFLGKISNSISKTIAGSLFKSGNSKLNSDGINATDSIQYDAVRDTNIIYKENSAIDNTFSNRMKGGVELQKAADKLSAAKYSEDVQKWDQTVIDKMNWYNFSGGTALNIYDDYTDNGTRRYAETQKVVHSLFNPYYGIDAEFGMGPGQHIAAKVNPGITEENDPSNCTIAKLVKMSKQKYTILGQARYKYADFMFCKELGMPNNHLITLRRYASPVGDRINGAGVVDPTYFTEQTASGQKGAKWWSPDVMTSDIGHMCCYFGGEDNKLEDILKYSFKSTFKNMQSSFDMIESKEDNRKSPLGMLLNSSSKNYNSWYSKGVHGDNNLVTWGIQNTGLKKFFATRGWYDSNSAMFYRDKNKIYEPKNTIQEVDYYEGKLQFTHEFSIVFSYKLRSYDNISPKMAMLDLIGNITRTCFNRGTFWGGRRQINGAQPNASGWNKANAFIDKAWDKLGSGLNAMLNGNFNFSKFLGSVSGLVSDLVSSAKKTAENMINGGASGAASSMGQLLLKINKKTGISNALKGVLKDTLGRPQSYAMDSLLTGGNTGMWHLTIGNPLKPIITIGNLEVTNTEIQHLGPLGIDDFPTELKVTVSFKHARPRDAVDIEKMYMFGSKSIYKTHVRTDPCKIYTIFDDSKKTSGIADNFLQSENNAYESEQQKQQEIRNQAKKEAEKAAEAEKAKQNGSTENTTANSTKNAKNSQPKQKSKVSAEKTQSKNEDKQAASVSDPQVANYMEPHNEASKDDTLIEGLDYIGEFDFSRMRANMDELV